MVGLRNLGHSCFINAVVQVLFGVQAFRTLLHTLMRDESLVRDLRSRQTLRRDEISAKLVACLSSAMASGKRGASRSTSARLERLLESIMQSNGQDPLSPQGADLIRSIQEPLLVSVARLFVDMGDNRVTTETLHESQLVMYLSYLCHSPRPEAFEQGDVSEFFHILIEQLDCDVRSVRPGLDLVSKFCRGSINHSILCANCNLSEIGAVTQFLEFPLEYPDLRLYVDHFINTETGASAWRPSSPDVLDSIEYTLEKMHASSRFCSSCGGTSRVLGRVSLASPPSLLVLRLSPIALMNGVAVKTSEKRIRLIESMQIGSGLCELVGVIVHHGKAVSAGHYSCYSLRESGWKHFNDSTVDDLSRYSTAEIIALVDRESHKAHPCLAYYSIR